MAVKNNLQVSNITFQGTQNTSASSSTSSAPKNINMTDNTAEQELLKRLGITKKQLDEIILKYADFYNLSPEKQVEIVSKINAPQPIESTEKTTTVEQTNATTQTPEKSVVGDDEPYAVKFDNKAFEAASNEEKAKIYAEELAKNKFMYTDAENKKTAQDWNALADNKKQKLINAELKKFKADKSNKKLNSDELSRKLQRKMTALQAANFEDITKDSFDSKPWLQQQEYKHDYLVAIGNNRTAEQEKYIKDQERKSELLCDYAKTKGIELSAVMPPMEIETKSRELGVNILDLEIKDLETKKAQNNGKLGNDDSEKLATLKNIKTGEEIKQKIIEKSANGTFEPSGLLESFEASEFGKEFVAIDSSDEEKCIAVLKFIKTLPPDKQQDADKLSCLYHELSQKDPVLAKKVEDWVISHSSIEVQKKYAKSNKVLTQAVAASSVNSFDESVVPELAKTQKAMSQKDPESSTELAIFTQNIADGSRLASMSEVYSGFGIVKVEKNLVDASHDHTRVSVDDENIINKNVFKNGSKESRTYAGTQNFKSYKENQIPLHSLAIKDKDVNDAMVKAGTYAKYAPENQLAGLNMHKDRFIQGDYSQQEIDNGLSALASQIKNCDVSVQSKAIESIVATGNVKATEVAVANLCTAPQVVQDGANLKGILNSAYPENPIADTAKSEIQQKIASGAKLTPQEYFSLSDREKTEYKANFFKSLPAAKQIAMLSSLTDVTLKKTIFKRLVSQDKNFFRSLVESDANTATFAYDMHIGEEIVMEVAKRKAASDIKFALLSQKIDADYEKKNSPLASTENNFSRNYTTDPNGFKFDPKELFKLDKNGNILA